MVIVFPANETDDEAVGDAAFGALVGEADVVAVGLGDDEEVDSGAELVGGVGLGLWAGVGVWPHAGKIRARMSTPDTSQKFLLLKGRTSYTHNE